MTAFRAFAMALGALFTICLSGLWIAATVRMVQAKRRGQSIDIDIRGTRSPGGGRMFVRQLGKKVEVEDYVPAELLHANKKPRRPR